MALLLLRQLPHDGEAPNAKDITNARRDDRAKWPRALSLQHGLRAPHRNRPPPSPRRDRPYQKVDEDEDSVGGHRRRRRHRHRRHCPPSPLPPSLTTCGRVNGALPPPPAPPWRGSARRQGRHEHTTRRPRQAAPRTVPAATRSRTPGRDCPSWEAEEDEDRAGARRRHHRRWRCPPSP
jgi:hypothetical protein